MSPATIAAALSFWVGLLSLSQEILWMRLTGFALQGRPEVFALVLTPFLFGIAAGAWAGRRLCTPGRPLLPLAAALLLLAAAADLLSLPLARALLAPGEVQLGGLALLIGGAAALKGCIFPMVHELGSSAGARLGRSVARVYLMNVLGSALGPLLTGYWLLDAVGLEAAMALIAAGCALASLLIAFQQEGLRSRALLAALAVLAAATWTALRPPPLIEPLAEQGGGEQALLHLAQNRHGVLHVAAPLLDDGGPITYGHNAYDGRIEVDMALNHNGLDRAYLLALLHPAPKRVLVIGLSSGAWMRVIQGLPGIEHIDAVEINPGYAEMIRRFPAVAPILDDPRLQLHHDDARRWLRHHAQARYDLVFMNNTFHWRAHASLLMSREFLAQLRGHLRPGGVLAMNTTGSLDALQTGLAVFGHVIRYRNFAYLSDAPLRRRADGEALLRACRIGEQPAFDDARFSANGIGTKLLQEPLRPAADWLAGASPPPEVISDLNAVSEFRHGRRSLLPVLQPLLPPTPQKD